MKKPTFAYLVIILFLTSISTPSLLCNKPSQSAKPTQGSTFSVDVNIPSFDEKTIQSSIQSTLISSVGFVASSFALALIYKGLVAHSTPQPIDAAAVQKLNATKLLGYGTPLLAAGILTILHPHVIDFFNS